MQPKERRTYDNKPYNEGLLNVPPGRFSNTIAIVYFLIICNKFSIKSFITLLNTFKNVQKKWYGTQNITLSMKKKSK